MIEYAAVLVAFVASASAKCTVHRSADFEWSYEGESGPSVWAEHYPACGGAHQSPVDLPAPGSNNPPPQPFSLAKGWSTGPRDMQLLNNGHTVQLNLPAGLEVSGGDLPESAAYVAAQFHFHWGADPSKGSEHTVDGQQMPLEMHVVLWDQKLGTFDNAKTTENGLAVLGFLFDIGDMNDAFQPIAMSLTGVIEPDSENEAFGVNLLGLVSDALDGGFYRYSGSLTTPTCDESVVWTVFMRRITISAEQLRELTKLRSRHGELVDNFRNTQPLNERVVSQFGCAALSTGGLPGNGW